jgi:hypothetical protein
MDGTTLELRQDQSGIEVALHPLLDLPIELSEALARWEELGWSEALPASAVGHRRILLRAALFEAVANLDEEQGSDFLAYQREQLRQLLGIRAGAATLEALSFVGSRSLRYRVRLGDTALPEDAVIAYASEAGVAVLEPCFGWLQRQVREWNKLGTTNRAQQLEFLGRVQSYAARLGSLREPAQIVLDEHTRDFEIIAPRSVRLCWNSESSDKFATYSLGAEAVLPSGESAALKLDALDPSAPVLQLSGKRYIAFDHDSHQVLRDLASTRQRCTKKEVAPVLQRPELLVPPGVSSSLFDLSEYSARVKGFEPTEKPKRPESIRSSGIQWFEAPPDDRPFLEIVLDDGGDHQTVLRFGSPEELKAAREAAHGALVANVGKPIQVCGLEIRPTEALYHQLDLEWALYESSLPAESETKPPSARLGVVLDDDFESARKELAVLSGRVPWNLLEEILQPGRTLKDHQRIGVTWMWSNLERGKPGVLLADDMGLGKTLQVAVLVALARAAKRVTKPSLVVCPVILIENWLAELARFFRDGAFGAIHVLHGDGARTLLLKDGRLDCDVLQRQGLVVTNYETLDRHQQSLLTVDWGCVVLDEAQAIKNPGTFRSRAARALKREFAICSTGTPVENRLGDLWTLFDFLSPHTPFGTREDFEKEYEEDGMLGAAKARKALNYPSARSPVLRRAKSEVLDLKEKRSVERPIAMTPEQYQLERRLVGLHQAKPKGKALELLGDLEKVYQHPWLLRDSEDNAASGLLGTVDLLIKASPKLQACLDILEEVRRREEKALVFTRWTRMQSILCHVLRERFQLPTVRVVNGESNQRRLSMRHIEAFSESKGFGVLVLSPLAAGVGLTITAANHVVHYGRWWNPAKEDQATDRAYRIGQTKPVTVYYPLLHHPDFPNRGFDIRLHELAKRKRELAANFLVPQDEAAPTAADLDALMKAESEVTNGGDSQRSA